MATDEAKRYARKKAKSVAKDIFDTKNKPDTHGVEGLSDFLTFMLIIILPLISFIMNTDGPMRSLIDFFYDADSRYVHIFRAFLVVIIYMGIFSLVKYLLFIPIYTYKYTNALDGFSSSLDDCYREFYIACKEAGIVKPLTPVMTEKMKKIAAVQEIEGDSEQLLKKYEHGYNVTESDAKKKLDAIKEKEREEKKEVDQFVGLSGTEKRKKMLLAKIPKEKYFTGGSNALYKKEADWAISGGIASGLAGGMAGIAAALDTQAKNASVRSYNQSISGMVNTLNMMELESVNRNNELREKMLKDLERIPTLLTETVSDQAALMRNIKTSYELKTTETGTVILQVSMQLKESVKIMNEAYAVVDGYLDAVITHKSGLSDTVPVTLPMYGLSTSTSTEKAMSVYFTDSNVSSYTVRFQPKNLWLIER